jgi:aryl-alcohol dehydrogenase-like predicted oxidoreductase
MEYTRLGSSGLKISRVAMGTMSFGEGDSDREGWPIPYEDAVPFFRQALDLGITFWDTANGSRIAETRGVSMAQVALAWVLKNPVVDAPIVGVTKQHHLVDAVAALDLELTSDEVTALEKPYVLRQATWF